MSASGRAEGPPAGARSEGTRAAPPPLPDPLPGVRTDVTAIVGSARRAAIGDLDGDGDREIVLAGPEALRVVEPSGRELASAPVPGGIQILVTADLDGDGHAEILAGWGQTREHRDARARITLHRLEGGRLTEEILLAPATSRQEIVAIVPMRERRSVLIGYFESKYMVTSAVASRGPQGWSVSKLASLRTATSYALGDVDGDGTAEVVVGRVYGDDQGSDGDAFVLGPGGARTPIPTTRGLRSLAIADADGDGRAEIFIGDGWHQSYGANARGLLTWVRHADGRFTSELVEDTVGQYAIEHIVPAVIDGKAIIVASGSHYVRAFARAGERWRGVTIGGLAHDVAAGDLDGTPGDEILLVGDRSEIVRLSGVGELAR
ncbi:MAG TPA: VCBS repeat-containing protein [Kofleriaceae bacterium]|nr:VCBS repeat-containing protein [Kofleriaceae bacterium]